MAAVCCHQSLPLLLTLQGSIQRAGEVKIGSYLVIDNVDIVQPPSVVPLYNSDSHGLAAAVFNAEGTEGACK